MLASYPCITLPPFAGPHGVTRREIPKRAKTIDILFAFTNAHGFVASSREFVEMIEDNSGSATRNPGAALEVLLPKTLVRRTDRAM